MANTKYQKRSQVFEINRQSALLRRLVGASMKTGMAPLDCVKRAADALRWVRSEARLNYWGTKHQHAVMALVVQGLQCGAESGQVIAARAIEAYRLCQEHIRTEKRRETIARNAADAAVVTRTAAHDSSPDEES